MKRYPEPEEYDVALIITVSVLVVFVSLTTWLIIHGINLINAQNALVPFTKTCETNLRERMGQECTTNDDCIKKCALRLQAANSTHEQHQQNTTDQKKNPSL